MLKKEMAQGTNGGKVAHVRMTVGEDKYDVGYYDYWGGLLGALNRKPYWAGPFGDANLTRLCFDKLSKVTNIMFSENISVLVTVNGITETSDEYIPGDVFKLSGTYGQTLDVTFDPPPTGYL